MPCTHWSSWLLFLCLGISPLINTWRVSVKASAKQIKLGFSISFLTPVQENKFEASLSQGGVISTTPEQFIKGICYCLHLSRGGLGNSKEMPVMACCCLVISLSSSFQCNASLCPRLVFLVLFWLFSCYMMMVGGNGVSICFGGILLTVFMCYSVAYQPGGRQRGNDPGVCEVEQRLHLLQTYPVQSSEGFQSILVSSWPV